jgi:uncharacterized membrane-anchored protein
MNQVTILQTGGASCASASARKEKTMSCSKLFFALACGVALAGSTLQAQEAKSPPKFDVIHGPAKAQMETIAQVDLPAGYVFLNGKDYRSLKKAEGDPISGHEMGVIASTNDTWSVLFEFSATGYIKDDDKDSLNADKLLASIKEGTAEANKERVKAGKPTIEVIGWEIPPKYDSTTHNLEWAIRGAVEGRPILNYNTRLLGRKGVMEVVLVVEPDQLAATLPTFRSLLSGYSFQTGQSYAEFRPGDKIAKYGLGALVIGGATVGAAKLGLLTGLLVFLKKGWKLIIVAFAAGATFLKKLFNKMTGRGKNSDSTEP